MTTDSLTPYEDIIESYQSLPLISLYMLQTLIEGAIADRLMQFGEGDSSENSQGKHAQGPSSVAGIQVDFPVQMGQNGVNKRDGWKVINGGLQ